jgi:hypothetical protein
MSQFLARLKALGQRAEQVRLAIDAAPARAAQLREAIQGTAGRLQELRGEIEGTLTDLRADTDTSIASKLSELDGADELFLRAGFRLKGIDMEQGASPRVLVLLERTGRAVESPDRLLAACGDRRTLLAILAALERARNTADDVAFRGFELSAVTVQLGHAPAVRMHWLPTEASTASAATPPPLPQAARPSTAEVPKPPAPATSAFGGYGTGSFFEARASATAKTSDAGLENATPEKGTTAGSPTPAGPASAAKAAPADWRKDALARFKKMPDLR